MSASHAKKSRGWMITMLLAGCALAYVVFVFLPGQVKVAKLRAKLREEQHFVIQADRLINTIEQTENELAQTTEFAAHWHQQAPDESELAAVYGQITDAARQSGMTLLRFEPQPAQKLATISQISSTLIGQGSFAETFDFLQRLEAMSSSNWITQLQMREAGEGGQELQCELTLTVFAGNRGISN